MIDIQHLNKAYRENKRTNIVFSNFNLQIEKGKTVLISGPSGGGKSTLLALIAGLSKPDSGEIRVLGKALAKLPDPFTSQFRRRNIGFHFAEIPSHQWPECLRKCRYPAVTGGTIAK
jgi:ABC-type lipoprotein export system ATPase subunit